MSDENLGFIRRYVFSLDHKVIGIQYIITGLLMALVGAFLASLIRLQLAFPGEQWELLGRLLPSGFPQGFMTPEFYISMVTMHGTIMVFFFISYVLVSGFGNYLVPLHVGAKDMAFPLVNMLSYWIAFPVGGGDGPQLLRAREARPPPDGRRIPPLSAVAAGGSRLGPWARACGCCRWRCSSSRSP